jgi:hypothetical protein
VSMTGFLVGGSFLAMALNDVTWLTFAVLAALDRIAVQLCLEAKKATPQPQVVSPPFIPVVRRPAALGSLSGKSA